MLAAGLPAEAGYMSAVDLMDAILVNLGLPSRLCILKCQLALTVPNRVPSFQGIYASWFKVLVGESCWDRPDIAEH